MLTFGNGDLHFVLGNWTVFKKVVSQYLLIGKAQFLFICQLSPTDLRLLDVGNIVWW